MKKHHYFDYEKVAKELDIPDSILKKILKDMKIEYPNDKMMYELHVLRAIKRKYWKKGTEK